MTEQQDDFRIAWWANNLEELDREVARLAMLCQVRILDPGVIERVLHKDASVCGTNNPVAFEKLHGMLMMHYAVREKAADALGQAQTAQLMAHIYERLKKPFGDVLGERPPARIPASRNAAKT